VIFTAAQIKRNRDEATRINRSIEHAAGRLQGSGTLKEQRAIAAQLLTATLDLHDFVNRDERPDTSPCWELVGPPLIPHLDPDVPPIR
jgi:hypothetical protein